MEAGISQKIEVMSSCCLAILSSKSSFVEWYKNEKRNVHVENRKNGTLAIGELNA